MSRHTLVLVLVSMLTLACRATVPGESCTNSSECGGGLICGAGRCTFANAGFTASGKVCEFDECRGDDDCFGNQKCTGGQCVCTTDDDCGGGRCSNGACVQCASDDHCEDGRVCVDSFCREPCVDAFECADLHACESGRCKYVGCTKDRECALSLGDVRAKCDSEKSCYVPCTADVECGGDLTGSWDGEICSNGRCTTIGCEADTDCPLFSSRSLPGRCVAETN